MEFKNIIDILDFAIEKEQEAVEFYRDLSEKEPISGVGGLFKSFSVEEVKHKKLLMDFKNKKNDTDPTQIQQENVINLKRSDYLVDVEYKPGMGFRDSLILAMKRELKAMKLYGDLVNVAISEEEKILFTLLVGQETKHKYTLEKMYDNYMERMGD